MSIGVTLDPDKAEQSRIAAEHMAQFLAKGGKIQHKADGESALMPKNMKEMQDMTWRKDVETGKVK